MLNRDSEKFELPRWAQVLDAPVRHVVLHGGRGGGKSVAAGAYVLLQARNRPINVLCARETQASHAESVLPLLQEMVVDLGWEHRFRMGKNSLEGINGSKFIFRGISDSTGTARRVKSLHGVDLCWVEEGQDISEESLNILLPTIRRPGSRFIWTMNPQTIDDPVWQRFVARPDPDVIERRVLYSDNIWLPEELEKERTSFLQIKPGPVYDNIWLGVPMSEAEGALWSRSMLDKARMTTDEYALVGDPDDLVVGIDPAGSARDKSDFTGITVVARRNDHGYVLFSRRVKATAPEWGQLAIDLYHQFGANAIVVEVSGAGADSIRAMLAMLDGSVYIQPVTPSGAGSKWERASPVATLYEQGKMHHVGDHPDLEAEMLSFTPMSKRDDLVDSTVWATRDMGLADAADPLEVAVF